MYDDPTPVVNALAKYLVEGPRPSSGEFYMLYNVTMCNAPSKYWMVPFVKYIINSQI